MDIQMAWQGAKHLQKYDNMLKVLSSRETKQLHTRVLNRVGDMARNQVVRVLAKQTGHTQRVIKKSIGSPRRANFSNLSYEMRSRGKDVSLKYFRPREERGGVVAYPFGKETFYPGHFILSGRPNARFQSEKLNGHVYRPWDISRNWGRRITLIRSGVIIPDEMVKGDTSKIFYHTAETVLPRRLEHELARILL